MVNYSFYCNDNIRMGPRIREVKTNIYQCTQQSAFKTREKPTPQQLQQQEQQQPHCARAQ